ncbi:uncharacterized protein LOC143249698 [Tachypleus tridentatus]|uniref:uncharacterized protein LOC143249698 n=1 Tax=Tachypleus tridentatus TaxID=6853 RepID=UPI003FCFCD0D
MTSNIKQYVSCRPTFPCVTLFLCVVILSFNYWVMSENYNDVLQQLKQAREQEQVAHRKRASSEKMSKFVENELIQLHKEHDKLKQTLDKKKKELANVKKENDKLNNKVVENESKANKISTDKQAREADLEKCHNKTKDKEERSGELEAEISSLKKKNSKLQMEFELLRNKIPGDAVLESKILQDVQQKETDQANENTKLQSENVKFKTKKAQTSVKKNKLPSKRKLLSFDFTKLRGNRDDYYQNVLKQDSTHDEHRIFRKPSSLLYKYKWPSQMSASNNPRNENMENIQRSEFSKSRNVLPYKTNVQIPLSLRDVSGNKFDSQKFLQSETVNSLSQQGLMPKTQMSLQGFQELGNIFKPDNYRFRQQNLEDSTYWQENKPKFSGPHKWSEESNNNIGSRRNSDTRSISNNYNRVPPSGKNKALETSFGPLVWNEISEHSNNNGGYRQDNSERYVWHKPIYLETNDPPKTDFTWNQADDLRHTKLPFEPQSKSSLLDNTMNYQTNFDVYKDANRKSSLQYGEDGKYEYKKQSQTNTEWELALLQRISKLLEKVMNNVNDINIYNNDSPLESLSSQDEIRRNEDGVKSGWELSSDKDQSKSLEEMQNSSLVEKFDKKPRTPSWLDLIQKPSESSESSETSGNLGTKGEDWRLHDMLEMFRTSDENKPQNGQLKGSVGFGSSWISSETQKVGLDEHVDSKENEEGDQLSSIYQWELPNETSPNNEQKVDDERKLYGETNYKQNLFRQQTSNQDVKYVPNWQVQWKIKDETPNDQSESNLSNEIIDKQWHEENPSNGFDQNVTVSLSSYPVNEDIQERKAYNNTLSTTLTDNVNVYGNERDFQNNIRTEDLMEKFNLPSEEETKKDSQGENDIISWN